LSVSGYQPFKVDMKHLMENLRDHYRIEIEEAAIVENVDNCIDERYTTCYMRWRKQHKEIRFYLKKEDYEILEKLASKHNMTVKDFVLKLIGNVKTVVKEEYERGYVDAIKSS